jgi:hypothetical protein
VTEPTRLAPVYRVRWGVYVVEGDCLRRPGLVGSADDLVLLAAVTPPPERITVELYRGNVLRDRRDWRPGAQGEAMLAMRLGRGAATAGSSRLRCRLLIDGGVAGERTVLLGRPAIDAQGRLAGAPPPEPSEPTRLAYARLLEEAWRSGGGGNAAAPG